MTREEIENIQRRVKFCMRRHIPVQFNDGRYFVTGMYLRYTDGEGFYYSVELTDVFRLNSTLTVGIDAVDFPSEGGGFKIADK